MAARATPRLWLTLLCEAVGAVRGVFARYNMMSGIVIGASVV